MIQISAARFTSHAVKKPVVVFASTGGRLTNDGQAIDNTVKKAVSKGVRHSRFNGDAGQSEVVTVAGLEKVVVFGLGSFKRMGTAEWFKQGVNLGKKLETTGLKEVLVAFGSIQSKVSVDKAALAFAEGIQVGVFRFDEFKTKMKEHQKSKIKKVTLLVDSKALKSVKDGLTAADASAEGVDLARRLIELPPNIATPTLMVEEARKFEDLGIEVDVYSEKELDKMGLNLLVAVGRGAEEDSQLIVMKYRGGEKDDKFKAVVGKGVMFDTGGYNLKPSGYLEDMKSDMAGAAAVMGTMLALAKSKAPVNVVGVCGCVMNYVSHNAFLPSDILTAYNGMTVEIGNTDAEGRLVLADALAYIIDKEKPTEVIDLATLTGAVMGALGGAYAGLFSNNERLASKLLKAGDATSERLWRLPTDDCFKAKAKLADLNNDGSRYGGASYGAVFLKNFVGKTPWAHLDIAGTAFGDGVPGRLPVKGPSGFGVRLLLEHYANSVKPAVKRRRRRRT